MMTKPSKSATHLPDLLSKSRTVPGETRRSQSFNWSFSVCSAALWQRISYPLLTLFMVSCSMPWALVLHGYRQKSCLPSSKRGGVSFGSRLAPSTKQSHPRTSFRRRRRLIVTRDWGTRTHPMQCLQTSLGRKPGIKKELKNLCQDHFHSHPHRVTHDLKIALVVSNQQSFQCFGAQME